MCSNINALIKRRLVTFDTSSDVARQVIKLVQMARSIEEELGLFFTLNIGFFFCSSKILLCFLG